MAEAEQGDTVTVHYTGTLEDGTVFDTSEERDPISFEIGADEVIPGFEDAVLGLEPGDTASTTLPPEEAYGPRSDERILPVPRSELPEDMDPDVGDELEVQLENGQRAPARVAETDESTVTLDLNHPLAGRELTFEVELVDVE
ncbi:MAG: peptidylprolyl isomerase [Candidatus Palauibacterales bacterium]|nr:peptidylprolyl isomerase [Candidatus Palauibacterales bacterium]